MPYASLGRRLAARFFDVAILISVVILVVISMRILITVGAWAPTGHVGPPQESWGPLELWNSLGVTAKLFTIAAFILSTGPIYYVFCHASPWQATLGKRLLNIYVTDDAGKRISIARSFGRLVAEWILNFFWFFLVSVITIAATKNRKALHDFVAGTRVLRGRPVAAGVLEPWRIAFFLGIPAVWMLATFLATM